MDSRVQRTRDVVLQAALDRLAESGLDGLTIDAVARQAGVARTTVYRHWTSPLEIVADALRELNRQPGTDEGHGVPVDRVRSLLLHLVEVQEDETLAACLPALIEAARREPVIRTFLDDYSSQRRRVLTRVIAEGIEDGSFPEVEADTAAQALAGALFYQMLLTSRTTTPEDVEALIRTVLRPP